MGVAFGAGEHAMRVLRGCAGGSSRSRASTGPARRRWPRALADALRDRGVAVELLREPGGVELSERIRDARQGPGADGRPARRGAALRRRARAARRRARVAAAATPARGCCSTASSTPRWPTRAPGAGWASRRSARSTTSRTGGLTPDRTLLLRVDPARARARQAGRGEAPDRLEQARRRVLRRGRRRLRRARGRRAGAHRVLDAAQPPADVLAAALVALEGL